MYALYNAYIVKFVSNDTQQQLFFGTTTHQHHRLIIHPSCRL